MQITQQLAILLVFFTLLYTMKYFGVGPFGVVRPVHPNNLNDVEGTTAEAGIDGFTGDSEGYSSELYRHSEL